MVLAELVSEAEGDPILATVELINKKLADVDWLVKCLYVLNEAHPIFAKSYKYVRPSNQLAANTMQVMNNDDGFFDGLPQLE